MHLIRTSENVRAAKASLEDRAWALGPQQDRLTIENGQTSLGLDGLEKR